LYNCVLNYRRVNRKSKDNGGLLPVGDIEKFIFSFVAGVHSEKWQNNHAVVRDVLKIIVDYDKNGGVTA